MDYALEHDFPGSADAVERLTEGAIDLNLLTPMSWGSSLPSSGGRSAPDGPLRTRVCDLCILSVPTGLNLLSQLTDCT
jgi:hypothetical protein